MTCQTCGSIYGGIVKGTEDRQTKWRCDQGHVQPWGEDEPIRMTGLRPAKAADLAKRPAWIDAAAREINSSVAGDYRDRFFVEIIEKHWRAGK